jgi:hypothetical protein
LLDLIKRVEGPHPSRPPPEVDEPRQVAMRSVQNSKETDATSGQEELHVRPCSNKRRCDVFE